jgi:hypothetical protein
LKERTGSAEAARYVVTDVDSHTVGRLETEQRIERGDTPHVGKGEIHPVGKMVEGPLGKPPKLVLERLEQR